MSVGAGLHTTLPPEPADHGFSDVLQTLQPCTLAYKLLDPPKKRVARLWRF